VRISEAALKRGYTVEQIEHAVVRHVDEFPDQGLPNLSILVGATPTGELLDVGVEFAEDGITIERVGHVMPARRKYLRQKKSR
jgi:hypothetical protein